MYFRDTVIYLIHIDLMRKCCQLITVDVDVDANESSRQLVEDGITTRTWLVDSPGGGRGGTAIYGLYDCFSMQLYSSQNENILMNLIFFSESTVAV